MPIHHNQLGAVLSSTERIFRAIADESLGAEACLVYENVLVSGAIIPWHTHAVEEVLVCLQGEAECSFAEGSPQPYRSGSVVIIPPNTRHTIKNIGEGELRQLAFFAGNAPNTEWFEPPGSVQ